MIVFNYMKSILKMIIFIRNMRMKFNKIVSIRVKIIPMIQLIINNIKKILNRNKYVLYIYNLLIFIYFHSFKITIFHRIIMISKIIICHKEYNKSHHKLHNSKQINL
jgi:hypothetical protein